MKEIYLVIAGVDFEGSRLLGSFSNKEDAEYMLNEIEFYKKMGVAPADMPYRLGYYDHAYIHETKVFEDRKEFEERRLEIQYDPFPKV